MSDNGRFGLLVKEGSWIVIGQILSVLGSLILVRILTEHLDPTQYGQLALGLTVAGLVNQMVMGGINNGISRYYSIAFEKKELHSYLRASRLMMAYATLAVLVIGLMLMTGLLWLRYFQWMGLASAALLFSLISGYNGSLSSIQTAARQRAVVAVHISVESWLKVIIVLGTFLIIGNSSTLIVFGFALSSLLITGSQYLLLRKFIAMQKETNIDSKPWIRQMWAFSWPFSTWGFFTWAQVSSDRWALEAFTSTHDVGMYSVLFQLGYTPISMASGLIVSFFAPIFFQRTGDGTDSLRSANVHKLILRVTLICFLIIMIGFLLTLVMHGWIFRLFVSTSYQSVSYLLPWMVLAGGLFSAGQILTLKVVSAMKSSELMKVKIVTALLGVFMNIYFTSIAGLKGIIAALLAFSVIYFVWIYVVVFQISMDVEAVVEMQ
jgi:O-antigen/teichoic acid export membrane protein